MALESKKQGGLFAGLSNLSNDHSPEKSEKPDLHKEAVAAPSTNTSALTPGVTVASSSVNHSNNQIDAASDIPAVTPAPTMEQPPMQPATPQSAATLQTNSQVLSQLDVTPLQQQYQQPTQQGSGVWRQSQLIDGRYKRNPKSFRTCIALTEDLHQSIEMAKQSGRITSLNDLINKLLNDYFNLN